MPDRLPHEPVPGVYALVDILAYPRYSMRLTELVMPLKSLEAMAMGKVLVASDVGGYKELITAGETGVLFKAGMKMVWQRFSTYCFLTKLGVKGYNCRG